MNPHLFLFLAKFYRASEWERKFIRAVAELNILVDSPDAFEGIQFPTDENPLGESGHDALMELSKFDEKDRNLIVHKLKAIEDKMPQNRMAVPAPRKDHWIKEPILRNRDRILGAALELHERGMEAVRVQMITDLLASAGEEISNITSYVHSLANQKTALVQILSENAGRHGLAFKLTDAGTTEAKALREKVLRILPGKHL